MLLKTNTLYNTFPFTLQQKCRHPDNIVAKFIAKMDTEIGGTEEMTLFAFKE
jgi:hypothetical protein